MEPQMRLAYIVVCLGVPAFVDSEAKLRWGPNAEEIQWLVGLHELWMSAVLVVTDILSRTVLKLSQIVV